MNEKDLLKYANEISEPPHWESHRVIKDLLKIIAAKDNVIAAKETEILSLENQVDRILFDG